MKKKGEESEVPEKAAAEPAQESAKKRAAKGDAADSEAAALRTLDEMVLNYKVGKYTAIPLISLWAKELRRREEHRHRTPNEILELAMAEVLDGKVGWDDLKKALANAAPLLAAVEEPAKGKKDK